MFPFKLGTLGAAIRQVMGVTLSDYAVNGFEPALVTDFASEYYRTSGSDTTFSSAVTHTGGLATMVDSEQTGVSMPSVKKYIEGNVISDKALLVLKAALEDIENEEVQQWLLF